MHTSRFGSRGSRFLTYALLVTAVVCRLGLAQPGHPPGHGPVTNPASGSLTSENDADQAVDRAIQELRNLADCVEIGFPDLSKRLNNSADTLEEKADSDQIRLFYPDNPPGDAINHSYGFTPGNSQNNTGQGPTYHYDENDDSNLILLAVDDFEGGDYRPPPYEDPTNPPQQQTGDLALGSLLQHELEHCIQGNLSECDGIAAHIAILTSQLRSFSFFSTAPTSPRMSWQRLQSS